MRGTSHFPEGQQQTLVETLGTELVVGNRVFSAGGAPSGMQVDDGAAVDIIGNWTEKEPEPQYSPPPDRQPIEQAGAAPDGRQPAQARDTRSLR
eukprot:1523601-Pyramimonas_sp.AAC.1